MENDTRNTTIVTDCSNINNQDFLTNSQQQKMRNANRVQLQLN